MNTVSQALTHRLPITDGLGYRARCVLRLHAYGLWERVEFETTETRGRTAIKHSFWLQVRECTTCGVAKTRPL